MKPERNDQLVKHEANSTEGETVRRGSKSPKSEASLSLGKKRHVKTEYWPDDGILLGALLRRPPLP